MLRSVLCNSAKKRLYFINSLKSSIFYLTVFLQQRNLSLPSRKSHQLTSEISLKASSTMLFCAFIPIRTADLLSSWMFSRWRQPSHATPVEYLYLSSRDEVVVYMKKTHKDTGRLQEVTRPEHGSCTQKQSSVQLHIVCKGKQPNFSTLTILAILTVVYSLHF